MARREHTSGTGSRGDDADEFVVEVELEEDAGTGRSEMRGASEELRETGRQIGDQTKEQVRESAQALREQAREKADELKERARETANERKGMASEKVSHIARALHAAAENLEQEGETGLARMAHQAADNVDRFTHYLSDNDVGGLVRDVENAGRSNPGMLMGSTFTAGMLLGRFLRASEPRGDSGSSSPGASSMGRGNVAGWSGMTPGGYGTGGRHETGRTSAGGFDAAGRDADTRSFDASGREIRESSAGDGSPGLGESHGRIDMGEVDR